MILNAFLIHFSTVFCLLWIANCQQSYTENLSYAQIQIFDITIKHLSEKDQKRCTKASLYAEEQFCARRCQLLYDYVPSAPYKNYQNYNKSTKQCQPRPHCPPISSVKPARGMTGCIDYLTGQEVAGVDASPPNYPTKEYTFICKNGRVGIHLGKKDCICDFGFKTVYEEKFLSKARVFNKCNKQMSIFEFIPSAYQIYYDPALENQFPHAADEDYWGLALVHYLKELRRQLSLLIWPHEVEMTMLYFDSDEFISDQEIVWAIWIGIVLVFILLLTIYEGLGARTVEEIVAEGQANQADHI